MKVWKPKEWLASKGHPVKVGKGRLSAEYKGIIEAALLADPDLRIEGYSVVKDNDANTSTAAPKVERVKADPNRVVDVPDATRDENAVMAYYMEGDKRVEVGMRTVDNNCGSSLSYCPCESPRVWVDYDRQVVVNFKPRN